MQVDRGGYVYRPARFSVATVQRIKYDRNFSNLQDENCGYVRRAGKYRPVETLTLFLNGAGSFCSNSFNTAHSFAYLVHRSLPPKLKEQTY